MKTEIRRDVWTLARELAMAIADSPELLEFRRTEDVLLGDEAAVTLVHEYEAAKQAVKFSKTKPPAEQAVLIDQFLAIEERFNAHAAISAHWAARERLDAFLDRINAVVTYPITGREEPKVKGGACGSGSGGGCGCGG